MSTNQPNPVTVHVTQEMIDAGVVEDCEKCPIARAVNELLSGDYSAEVYGCHSFIRSGHVCMDVEMLTPDFAASFIKEFDNREPVNPFSFTLPREAFPPGVLKEGV